MSDFDWNDLRYVLAGARHKSAAAAARSLNVSHATVLRRIQQFEKKIGTLLFARHTSGLIPTATGLSFAELGISIEKAFNETRMAIDAASNDLAGRIRVTTTDSLASYLIAPILADFSRQFPQIEIDLTLTNNLLDLDRLEAEVSLRICANPPGDWVGRKVARLHCGVYATPDYLMQNSQHQKTPAFDQLDWILPFGSLADAHLSQWLPSQGIKPKFSIFADSLIAIEKLATQSIGAAVLPDFVANASGQLQKIYTLPEPYSNDVWLLCLPQIKKIPRVKRLLSFLTDGIQQA